VSERELEREGGSLSANTGHEKCMEVVGVSLLERELQRKRAQTGVSELSLSLSPGRPRGLLSRCLASHVLLDARPPRALHLLSFSSSLCCYR